MGVRFVSFCALLGASACVQPFSGSDVQIDFGTATQRAFLPGDQASATQPPANTFYILYASQKRTDDTGAVVENYLFDVQHFEIRKLIDTKSPCFIDLENARFPGLHVTEFANKVSEQTGIVDPINPPAGASQGDITDVLDAQRRISYLPGLENTVKVVTDESDAQYGASETNCIEDNANVDQTKFPPPKCTGDQSNALRLKLCRAFWATNKSFYEGSDKVFTLPINGAFRGVVHGSNPINNGFLGGSEFFVDDVLESDAYLINWQFKDLNGDGIPDFAAGTPDADKKNGHVYMTGVPNNAARGVTNVLLVNPDDASISAQMAIFPDVANDGTHF